MNPTHKHRELKVSLTGWLLLGCLQACGSSAATAIGNTQETDVSDGDTMSPTPDDKPADAAPAAEDAGGSHLEDASLSAPPKQRICDGSDKLRLRLFVGPQEVVSGGAVYIENGNASFAVDGKCEYWINPGWGNVQYSYARSWRTGRLPPDLERALDAALDLEHLDDLSSCPFNPTLRDVGRLSIRSEYTHVKCQGNSEALNSAFGAAWALVQNRASELYSAGQDLTGPIHIIAYLAGLEEIIHYLPWMLDTPVADYFVPFELGRLPGNSGLVTNLHDAAKLRALRSEDLAYRASNPEYQRDGVYVTDGDGYAVVHLRDALPYEDEHGLLPFSD